MKIHLEDNVLVTTGKDRGKVGKVIRVLPKSLKVTIEKINIRVRHIKKRPGQSGQKIAYEAPIDVSNVSVICPHCKKTTRVNYTILKTGRKQRICKKCHQSLDHEGIRRTTKKR